MKKMFVLLVALILTIVSCGKKCQDCDPISTSRYLLINNSNSDIQLIFYGNSLVSFINDTIYMENNEKKAFMNFVTGSPVRTALNFEYALCDSIHILDINGLRFTSKGLEDCQNIYNVLCKNNYSLSRHDAIKSGKDKGDNYSEYELIIK